MTDFPLALTTELLLGGVWTDVSADVRYADGVQISRGRADQASQPDPSSCELTLTNRDGKYSPRNPVSPYYGLLGRNTPIRVRVPTTEQNHMALPGGPVLTLGCDPSYASAPSTASFDIVGDIDVRVDVQPQSWRPWSNYGLAQRYENGPTGYAITGDSLSKSWRFWLTPTGYLVFGWNSTGDFPDEFQAISTVTVDSSSTRLVVRATLDVDNGAGGHTVRFYTDTNLNGTFTQLGADVVAAGVTAIYANTADLDVGRTYDVDLGEENRFQGKIYGAQVRSGIAGTVVASPDFTAHDVGTSSFADAQSNPWTMFANATMANPGARFHGEVSSWPQRWDKRGVDVSVPLQTYGVMRRLGQGAAGLRSTMYRLLTSDSSLVQYWPCEDGSEATELASAKPNRAPMQQYGSPSNSAFDGFKASESIPTVGTSHWIGKVATYTQTGEHQVTFLLSTPAAGVPTTSGLLRIRTTGGSGPLVASRFDLDVTAAGSLHLYIYNDNDVLVGDSGNLAWAVNGRLLRVSLELRESVGPNFSWDLSILEVGASSLSNSMGDTLSNRSMGRVIRIGVGLGTATGDLGETAIGHISVHNVITAPFLVHEALEAYTGELATTRILRLCQEENIPVIIEGDSSDATRLGPQLPGQFLELLREAADADLGVLYEPRELLGLAYRTRASMYAQDAALTLVYTDLPLSAIEPVEDDDATRNDITVSRINGSSYRAEQTTGALSTSPPPSGVGRYDEEVSISLRRDEDLPDQAYWRLHLGTLDEARYPVLSIDLRMPAFTGDAALALAAKGLAIGDRVVVTHLPSWLPPGDVQQLVQGFTETLTRVQWLIEMNCAPASPWDVAVWDDTTGPGEARYSSDGTTLSAAVPASGSALVLTGAASSYASTPDTAALDIVGDIDIRAHVAMDDWTPASTNRALVGKFGASGARSYLLAVVATTGRLRMQWTADGATSLTADSTVSPTVVDGAALWVRATLDVNNGAAGRDIKFYTSVDGETWTQLGATVTQAGVTSIFSGTAPVEVGSTTGGTSNLWPGRVSAVEIRNGIDGTVVTRPEFGAQPAGTTVFVGGSGLTWTVQSAASIAAVATTLFPDGLPVNTPTGPVWSGADAPFDIVIGGERMTVTAVSGTGAAQVFTVIRSVNGVSKAHAAGADVELFKPAVYAL